MFDLFPFRPIHIFQMRFGYACQFFELTALLVVSLLASFRDIYKAYYGQTIEKDRRITI